MGAEVINFRQERQERWARVIDHLSRAGDLSRTGLLAAAEAAGYPDPARAVGAWQRSPAILQELEALSGRRRAVSDGEAAQDGPPPAYPLSSREALCVLGELARNPKARPADRLAAIRETRELLATLPDDPIPSPTSEEARALRMLCERVGDGEEELWPALGWIAHALS